MTSSHNIVIVKILISGRVQGVGYRSWACGQARGLGLSGWVRNRLDGTVEALVAGDAANVQGFIEQCYDGPLAARVTSVSTEESTEPVPNGFTQRESV